MKYNSSRYLVFMVWYDSIQGVASLNMKDVLSFDTFEDARRFKENKNKYCGPFTKYYTMDKQVTERGYWGAI